jgi:hypothetical protein
MHAGVPWSKAEVVMLTQSGGPGKRYVTVRLLVMDGPHAGKRVEDLFLVDNVFTACHQNALKLAAGGSFPRPGELLQVQVIEEGDELAVGFKGYK